MSRDKKIVPEICRNRPCSLGRGAAFAASSCRAAAEPATGLAMVTPYHSSAAAPKTRRRAMEWGFGRIGRRDKFASGAWWVRDGVPYIAAFDVSRVVVEQMAGSVEKF